jgi:aspartate/tyrosine/aromatic aminotransferase
MATITQTTATSQAPQSLFVKIKPLGNGGPFALNAQYMADSNQNKVNLIIGAYRDDNGNPWALSSVVEVSFSFSIHEICKLTLNAFSG